MPCRLCRIGFLCAAVTVIAGCGGSKKSELVVRGQVLYRGEPVSGGLIVFAPDSDRGSNGPLVSATLAADGSFTVVMPDGKPIPPGWYRIAVAPRAGTVDMPTVHDPYPGLPARYRNPALSGLMREIKVGADNLICLDLDDL